MSYHYETNPDGYTTPGPAYYDEEIRRVAGDLARASGGSFQETYELLLGIGRVPEVHMNRIPDRLGMIELEEIGYRDHGGPIRAGRNPVDTRSGAPAYHFIVDEVGEIHGHRPKPIDPDILRRALTPPAPLGVAAIRWPGPKTKDADGLVWVDLGTPTLTAGGIEWRRLGS